MGYELLGHLHSVSQSPQHSLSQLQSGQSVQQSLLQQPGLAAGAVEDDDKPAVPAASAASNTKPSDSFAIMERIAPVKRKGQIQQQAESAERAVSNNPGAVQDAMRNSGGGERGGLVAGDAGCDIAGNE